MENLRLSSISGAATACHALRSGVGVGLWGGDSARNFYWGSYNAWPMGPTETRMIPNYAFGIGPGCNSLDVLRLPDGQGCSKEHVLRAVGQHVALLKVEDGDVKV